MRPIRTLLDLHLGLSGNQTPTNTATKTREEPIFPPAIISSYSDSLVMTVKLVLALSDPEPEPVVFQRAAVPGTEPEAVWPQPGFTPGESWFANYGRNELVASSPPGFMPGERGFEDSRAEGVKPWLRRREADGGRVAQWVRW